MGAGLLLVAGAFAGVACSDSSSGSQTTDVLAGIAFLDGAGLHDIDDGINEDGQIPAGAHTTALKSQAVVTNTEWPDDLEDSADALEQVFADMAAALEGDAPDVEAAGAAAAAAHDAEHEFSADVWAWLYEEAGMEVEAEEH